MWRFTSGRLAVAAATLALSMGLATAAPTERKHGLSIFGDLKYDKDFKHFKYVNPQAPKGGRIVTFGGSSFDSFNPFIIKGDTATGVAAHVFDTLMKRANDEPDAVYGLVAESASVATDGKSVTFHLRPEARFSDGSPITATDVAFSFETLKAKGSPGYALPLRDVVKAEAIDRLTVRYELGGTRTRDLPLVIAELPVLSKAYYEAKPFDQTTLEPPLGSGPYVITDFKQGTYVTFARRKDYWGKDLPVNVGQNNFDEVRYDYFRDRAISLEALKAGQLDLREEFTALHWSTGYDVPAVREGRLIKVVLPDESPSGAQGLFLNTRLPKFSDPRVRRALDLAFDFEWMNKNIFYGLYTRTASFFENSDMKASGKPSPEELALLEPFRDKLPKEVFGMPYESPKSDGSGMNRDNMRLAAKLLDEAGWTVKNGQRTNDKGEVLSVEFLFVEPTFLRVIGPFEKNLKALGVLASSRQVDPAQYERRVKAFEFDIIMQRYVMSLTPGVELKNYWSSDSADMKGSRNLAGIKNPAVDALIDKVIEAKSRANLVTAARALDRVMRAEHCWIPNWYKASHTVAYWNKFSRPATKPKYARGILETWWYDAAKAQKLTASQ
jgi:microcin C transport system substrate-binding protein